MKKGITAAIAVLLIAGLAWYFLSPGLAMKGLRDAAIAGDKEELRERVDFPAVRDSMKSQLKAFMAAEMAKEKDNNPFAAMGMMFASAIVDPMVDGIVSPEGMKAMVESGKFKSPGKPAAKPNGTEAEWDIQRSGLDRFTARPKVAAGEKAPTLVFRRDGLGWDLVDIEIPAGGLSAGAGT